jgi:hypothetical protein
MSEQNRALAIRWFKEVWNEGSEAAIDELFHPEGHAYGFPDPTSDLIGPEAFKAVHRQPRAPSPASTSSSKKSSSRATA